MLAKVARLLRAFTGTALFLSGCLAAYIAVAGVTFGAIAWRWALAERID